MESVVPWCGGIIGIPVALHIIRLFLKLSTCALIPFLCTVGWCGDSLSTNAVTLAGMALSEGRRRRSGSE